MSSSSSLETMSSADYAEQLKTIADTSSALICAFNQDLTYIYANPAYAVWIGQPGDRNLRGITLSEALSPQRYESALPDVRKALSGETVKKQASVPMEDGETVHLDVSFTPMYSADGSVAGVVYTGVDVTDQQRRIMSLQQEELRAQLALQLSDSGLWYWTMETGDLFVSERFNELMGVEAGSITRIVDWFAMVHPDDRQDMLDHFQGQATIAAPLNTEFRI